MKFEMKTGDEGKEITLENKSSHLLLKVGKTEVLLSKDEVKKIRAAMGALQ